MSNTSKNVVMVLGLLILGGIGYAYVNPAFAATCKSTYSKSTTWVRQQTGSAQVRFKNSKFYAAYTRALRDHKILSQTRKKQTETPAVAAKKAPAPDLSPEAIRKREEATWSTGQRIAHGPAFAQHAKEFGFRTEDEMASHIDRVIGYASPSTTKQLCGGQTAYWDFRTHAIIIVFPRDSGGTMYKPEQGYPYFKDLKPAQ